MDGNTGKLPAAYANLRERGSRSISPGTVVAEGARTVRQALESDWAVRSLALTPDWYASLEQLIAGRPRTVGEVFVREKTDLDSVVGFRLRQGVLAEVVIPDAVPREHWIRGLPESHVLIGLDGLTDATNVGAVSRNAAAFGAHGLVVDGSSASPLLRRAVRVSMGGIFRLDVLREEPLIESLTLLRRLRGTKIIATDLARDARPPDDIDWSGNICLVLGSEERGVSPSVVELADDRVRIPMETDWDSLNVAAASAILLHEARRQALYRPPDPKGND